MRRIIGALAPCISVLVLAASAQAWVPVATYDVPDDGVATCLRDAGAGRFGLLGRLGRTTTAMDVLQLGSDGLAPTSATSLGWLVDCPAVSGAAGGGVSLAGVALTSHADDVPWSQQMRAATAGTTPQSIGRPATAGFVDQSLAVNASGAAVVAWVETNMDLGGPGRPYARLLAAMRPAGGATFGQATVVDKDLDRYTGVDVVTGIDGAGRATLAWTSGEGRQFEPSLSVASADAHGVFAVDQRFDAGVIDDLALVVNPDGRALLASLSGLPLLYERQPGAARFTSLPQPHGDPTVSAATVALALGPKGEAVVATSGDEGRVFYATRPAERGFGDLIDLTHRPPPAGGFIGGGFSLLSAGDRPGVPYDGDSSRVLSAAVHGDQAVVAWIDKPDDGSAATPNAAFGTISGGLGRPERLGSPCRAADAIAAVVLDDATVAVAWADNARAAQDFGLAFPEGDGRLSIVRTGSTPPPAAAPRVTATFVSSSTVHAGEPLKLKVRCPSGPCEVYTRSKTRLLDDRRQSDGRPVAISRPVDAQGATLRLPATGPSTFVAPGTVARVPVIVTACTPDGSGATTRTLRPRLRGAPLRPMPHIVGVRATRRGLSVRVVVRLDRPLRGVLYAYGRPAALSQNSSDYVRGRGRQRFVLSVSGTTAAPLRRIQLAIVNQDHRFGRPRAVRVR